jgi:hypothetical protein
MSLKKDLVIPVLHTSHWCQYTFVAFKEIMYLGSKNKCDNTFVN